MSSKLLLEDSIDGHTGVPNATTSITLGNLSTTGRGQSFTGNGATLSSVIFYLTKVGSPTGNITANIYAHTGTFGSSGLPTGASLAASATVDSATFTDGYVSFTFTGINQITLTAGTNYFVTLEKAVQTNANCVGVAVTTADNYLGNHAFQQSGTWFGGGANLIFSVVGTNNTTNTLLLEDNQTFYLDGHIGISDPGTNWTNDANAFDGSITTSATTTAASSTSSLYLYGQGTTAPSTGSATISSVQARLYGTSGTLGRNTKATIFTASLAEQLNASAITAISSNSSTGWGSYVTLTAPTAGWSWSALNALEVKLYADDGTGAAYRVELLVTTTTNTTDHLLLENDVQLRQSTAYQGTAAQTNMTFTLPNAPVVGNLLIANIMYFTGDDPFLTPSGWTLKANNETGQAGIATLYRVVQAGDTASWNLTVLSVADQNSGYMWEVMGQHATPATAFNQYSYNEVGTATTTITSNSITPSVLDTLVLSVTLTIGTTSTDVATYSAGWSKRAFIKSTFQPAWAAQLNGYTTDTTTAINNTVSTLPSAQAATVIMAIAPDVAVSGTSTTVTQVAATVTASGGTETVAAARNVAITQVAGTVTATGGTQASSATAIVSTSVTQSAATVTASGGTQVVASVQRSSITQVAGTVTASGGTEAITAHTNTLQNNVASYWKFDDASGTTVADSVGGNPGTWQGTLGSQWGTGKIGGDGVFNGTDNYVLVGNKSNLSFNTGNYTLSAWVKTTATSRQTILHKYEYTGTSVESGYYIDMLAGGNIRTVYETTNANLRNTDGSITVNDGNWHLVTVVRPSTTGDILLYIDGVLDPSVTHAFNAGTPGNIDNTIPFAIGQSISASIGVNNWNGQIDGVGTWNRDLTSAEITSLYNSGVGQQYPFGNVAIIQVAATVTASGGTQVSTATVNASVTQVAATVTATGGTQTNTAISNSAIAQLAATVTASGGTQVVTSVRNVSITQVAGTVTASGGTESVTTVNNVTITQVAGVVTATGGTQANTAVSNAAITQLAATVTASGGTETLSAIQRVAITQVAGTVTAAGGTEVVATVQNQSIVQVAATVTASGGTQVLATVNNVAITQVAGTVTASGGTETVNAAIKAAVAQVAGTVTASGGTQTLATVNIVAISQVAGTVTATGGTQSTGAAGTVSISQVAATVTATGGIQVVHGTSVGDPGYPKIKIGGVEVIKPLKYKSGGVFVQKPLKAKIGGVWTPV